MPQLDPTPFLSQIFWLGVAFSILYLSVKFYFFPRLESLFYLREDVLGKKIEETKHLKDEAENLDEQIQHLKSHAHEKTQTMLRSLEKKLQKENLDHTHMVSETHQKSLAQAQKELDAFKKDFFQQNKETEAELTQLLFEKATQLKLDQKVYQEAVSAPKETHDVA